jgi:WD40 repeat protein
MYKKRNSRTLPMLIIRCIPILAGLLTLCLPPVLSSNSPDTLMLDRGVMHLAGTAYSYDGKIIAASGSDNDIILYDTTNGHLIRQFVGASWPSISKDGKELCGISKSGELLVWDIATGKTLLDKQTKMKSSALVIAVEFSPNKQLVAVTDTESLRIIDVASGQQLSEIREEVMFGNFSFDGKKIVGLVRNKNVMLTLPLAIFTHFLYRPSLGDIRVWDVSTGHEIAKMPTAFADFFAAAVSPVSDTLAMSKGYCTRIMDVETGKMISEIDGESAILSPDGSTAVNGLTSCPTIAQKGTIVHEPGKSQQVHELSGLIYSDASFSGDSKRVVTYSDNKLEIYDVATGKRAGEISPESGNGINTPSLNYDGKLCSIVKVDTSGTVLLSALFDVASAKKLRDLPLEQKAIKPEDKILSKFSPNGESIVNLVTDEAAHKTDVQIWNAADSATRKIFSIPRPANYLTFSPDSKSMACSFLDGTVAVYELSTGREIHKFQVSQNHESSTKAAPLRFSADGNILYAGRSDLFKEFDLATGKEIKRTQLDFSLDSIAITPKGKVLLGGWAQALSICNFNGKESSSVYAPLYSIGAAGFSQDGKHLYGLGGRDQVVLRIWDAATGALISTNTLFDTSSADDALPALQCKFSGDLKTAVVPIAGSVAIVDVKDGHERLRLPLHAASIGRIVYASEELVISPKGGELKLLNTKTGKLSKLALSGGENVLVAVTADGAKIATKDRYSMKTKVLDVKSGRVSSSRAVQKYSEDIAFSPDGKTLYEGSIEKPYLTAVSVDDEKNITLPAEVRNGGTYAIALSNDGKMLLTGDRDEIRAWNLSTNKMQWICKKNDSNVSNLTCKLKTSPNNKVVAASSTDMKVRLWNLATGLLLHTLSTDPEEVIEDLVISPDSKLIAVSKQNGSVFVWSVDTGKQLANIAISGGINSLAFSPDSKMLLGASTKGSVIFWNAENLNELFSFVPLDKTDWVVLDAKKEHFDASPGGANLVHIYKDNAFLPSEEVKKIGYKGNLLLQEIGGRQVGK